MAIHRDSQLACTICASTFFYVARAEQFTAGGYGSAEFRSTSNAPKTLLVCAGCGQPVFPKPGYYSKGTTAAFAEDEFRKSIEAGHKHRAANSINNVANIAASPAEVQELRDQVDELRKAIVAITNPVAPAPVAKVHEPKAAKKAKPEEAKVA